MPLVLAVLVAIVLFFPYEGQTIATQILGAIKKGPRLTRTTSEDDELIDQSPQSIAEQMGVDLNRATLARVISSEEGNSEKIRQLAIAYVTFNNGGQGPGVFTYACGSGGRFGHQSGSRRPVSTFADAYAGHLELANLIFDGGIGDPTNGATNFYGPATQDKLNAKDPDKYDSAEEIDRRWTSRGLVAVDVDGIDSRYLKFYRPG